MLSTRFMLVGLLILAPGAFAACTGNATRAGNEAEGKRCCFDDLIFESNVTATGLFCKAGEWVRPGGACTLKKAGKTVASTKCGHPVKTNGKFEVQCSSSKGVFSTNYSSCSTASGTTTGTTGTTGSTANTTTGAKGATSGALQLAAVSAATIALVALAAVGV